MKATQMNATQTIAEWPDESREAAQLVIDAHGEPDEATTERLIWHHASPWKRIVATRAFYDHRFPVPHIDSVESVLDYRMPAERCTDVAHFDGSVMVDRTAGEVSARCHDEQANFLALNLMHDVVSGAKSVEGARDHYATAFLDFRRKRPTPYMDGLQFAPPTDGTADPDQRVLSDEDLQRAKQEGERA